MKTILKTSIALLVVVVLSSFTIKNSTEFVGTYGISNSESSHVKLTLNPDYTYNYQDLSDANKNIIVSGTWKSKGKKVALSNSNSTIKFHKHWTFFRNGQVAKSRKGLAFYRLCKIAG
jgi:uncharacterized protein YxeA